MPRKKSDTAMRLPPGRWQLRDDHYGIHSSHRNTSGRNGHNASRYSSEVALRPDFGTPHLECFTLHHGRGAREKD